MSKQILPKNLPQRKIEIKPIQFRKFETLEDEEKLEDVSAKVEIAKQELLKIQEKKNSLLHETENLIQQEKEKWLQEKEILVEEAKKEGFQAGYQEGEKAGYEQYVEKIKEANHLVDLVKIDYQKTLEKTEDVIINMAIHTAEKILAQKLMDKPTDFLHIVRAALKEIKDQSVVSIYLHPKDYENVLAQKSELKRIVGNDTKLSLYMNDELKESSCIIEHPFGQIDASVDTQLEAIRNALKEFVMEQER